MLITNRLSLPLPADEVFERLLDLEAVTPCIPGARLGPADANGAREASIEVRFGPMRFNYAGRVRIVDEVLAERRVVLEAVGSESAGAGTAHARIAMAVTGGAETLVEIETDLHVTGGIAQIGAGMIEQLSEELLGEFATCLKNSLDRIQQVSAEPESTAPPTPGAAVRPADGVRLLIRLLGRRLRRLAFWKR